MSEIIKVKHYEGKFWEPFENDMFKGYAPSTRIEIEKGDPSLTYTGGKIPLPLLRQVLAFMKWSYDLSKGESQARLFYNEETKEWGAWVFPQEKSYSLSTKEIADHPKRAEGMERFPSPWEPFGTVHHHCAAGAFQSGTDKHDEQNQPGLHITYGHMDKACYDWHARINIKGVFYLVDKPSWFTLSDTYNGFPAKVRDFALTCLLTDEVTKEELDSIPQEWKDNIIVVPPPSMSKAITVVPDGKGGSVLHTRRGERTTYHGYNGRTTVTESEHWSHESYEHGKIWDADTKQYYWEEELRAMGKMPDWLGSKYPRKSDDPTLGDLIRPNDEAYERFLKHRGIDMADPVFAGECMDYLLGTLMPAIDVAFLVCPKLTLDYSLDDLFHELNKVGMTNKNRLTGEHATAVEIATQVAMKHGMPWYWFTKAIEYHWNEEAAKGDPKAEKGTTVEDDATRNLLTEEEVKIISAKVKEARRVNMAPVELQAALSCLDCATAVDIITEADAELNIEEMGQLHGIGV